MVGFLGKFSSLLSLDKDAAKKILYLATSFFCITVSATIIREMKNSLFIMLAGIEYFIAIRFLSLLLLAPATFLYMYLVDRMSRYELIKLYSTVYAVITLCIVFLLSFIKVDLSISESSFFQKLFGWLIYIFYAGVAPYVVGLFWSIANSVASPGEAQKGYAIIVALSRVGGIVVAAFAWCLFRFGHLYSWCSDLLINQILLMIAALFFWLAPRAIYSLFKDVKDDSMHGYEASYKKDHEKSKQNKKVSFFAGLLAIKKHFYLLAMFGMMFFYQLIHVMLGLKRFVILENSTASLSGLNELLFQQRFIMGALGLLISLFCTGPLINRFGERICLLIIPAISTILFLYSTIFYSDQAIIWSFMLIVALNFSFAKPLREILYIPTVNDIRFKTKAWIDSFGLKTSIGLGTILAGGFHHLALIGAPFYTGLFFVVYGTISIFWFITAWFLGRKYDDLIKANVVIGLKK